MGVLSDMKKSPMAQTPVTTSLPLELPTSLDDKQQRLQGRSLVIDLNPDSPPEGKPLPAHMEVFNPWREEEASIRASGRRSGRLIGRASGCLFCTAIGRETPQVGERIRVICEARLPRGMVGMTGTVIETPVGESRRLGEIFVEIDDESWRSGVLNFDQVLVETLPRGPLPWWAPPIPLKEAGQLDMIARILCDEDHPGSHPTLDLSLLYQLIEYIWRQRLPLTADEVWVVLEAHGAPLGWRSEVMNRYQYGIEALIRVVGRKPFKNRRLPPLFI